MTQRVQIEEDNSYCHPDKNQPKCQQNEEGLILQGGRRAGVCVYMCMRATVNCHTFECLSATCIGSTYATCILHCTIQLLLMRREENINKLYPTS